jgi:UDP-2,3-diacylglucosamine hydrolase
MSPGGRSPERQTAVNRGADAPGQDLQKPLEVRPIVGGPLAILAGGGTLPVEIANHVLYTVRHPVHIIALEGEADTTISTFPHTWVNWGQVGRMVKALRQHGCTQMVLAGTVRRPNLKALRPDLGLLLALPRLLRTMRGGDDSVLRRVIAYFESKGLTVVGLADVAPHLLASAGPLGACQPSPEHHAAMARGRALLTALGPFDVGQAVVATRDEVVAIEGAGGTDAMLAALAARRQDGSTSPRGQDGVLVKWPKPGQELRLDLPAAGPRTVELARQAGLSGIAVQAGAAVFLERTAFRNAADTAGLFVVGMEPPVAGLDTKPEQSPTSASGETVSGQTSTGKPAADVLHMRTRRVPSTSERLDIAMGRQLLAALTPHGVGTCAVVARQYVLAVEARETVLDVLGRAAGLRQWSRKSRRAVGTLVLGDTAAAPSWLTDAADRDAFVAALKAARLAGIAVVTPGMSGHDLAPFLVRLNDERLFLVTVEPAP